MTGLELFAVVALCILVPLVVWFGWIIARCPGCGFIRDPEYRICNCVPIEMPPTESVRRITASTARAEPIYAESHLVWQCRRCLKVTVMETPSTQLQHEDGCQDANFQQWPPPDE